MGFLNVIHKNLQLFCDFLGFGMKKYAWRDFSWIFCVKRVSGFSFRMLMHTPKKSPALSAKNLPNAQWRFSSLLY